MKKIFMLTISFLLLISTAAWALEDSDGMDTEREPIEFEYVYKFEYEYYPDESRADDTEAGVRINIKADEELITYETETRFIALHELLNFYEKNPDFGWDDFAELALGVGGSLAFTVEVDVKAIGDMAKEAAEGAADVDGDDKITI